jgi:hypothetical protein
MQLRCRFFVITCRLINSSMQAEVIACQKLKDQMKEVKDAMKNPEWIDLVKKCFMKGVDLTAHHM